MRKYRPIPKASIVNVKQLLMVEPTSQAACKTGRQEEAELQSSNHAAVRCKNGVQALQPVSLCSAPLSIDMLMRDRPAEEPE